jgi:hypothetical protein
MPPLKIIGKRVKIIGNHPLKGHIGMVIAVDYLPVIHKNKYKIKLLDRDQECYANLNELGILGIL